MKRVILDTNILISMVLGGKIGEINDAWKAEKFLLVVSGDKHLLDLSNFRNIPILSGREFLDQLKEN